MARAGRATLAAIAAAVALAALGPGSAAAASIFGTVSDETTHAGIVGVEVCPTPQPYTFEVECVQTDSGGHYSFAGLQPTQYMLFFSAATNNLPYVSEFYDNKPTNESADLVTLSSDEARQLDVELAQGGSISGTLTDEDGGAPVANMVACTVSGGNFFDRCAKSDAGGHYQVNGLPTGEYSVEFISSGQANYLRELYKDAESWAQATRVPVTAPGTTTGIDAELAKGAQILGHVSQAGTGLPLPDAFVCAEQQPPGEFERCDSTDADGNYTLMGLLAGTYLVAFEPIAIPTGPAAAQWWQGVPNFEEATPIEIVPPETRTGIDGQVDRPIWGSPEEGSTTTPTTPVFSNEGVPPIPQQPRLPKCRKGFHRKLVKGKKRCVRKHARHRGRHRRHR
ncbi:MAG TPA: carboxypeptidase-like regulatory domain-containing protein [Solirubrobacterales bacterium]|nr:carboxypeptidase-like regulatory domain-containing protein [Solirubrobacterales bacterium]